ncbi:MAG: hypothetical protein GF398_01540 [Chitinivibrionales bacterium]|nr:hypothetical protein [Chitinivibrionales bacterium]
MVSSPVRTGKKASRWESTDKRTEGAPERFLDRETDLWIGWSVYVEKWADNPGRADVTQFHGYQPSCSNNDPKIHVDIKRLKRGITFNWWEGGRKITVDRSGLKPVQKGRWTDLVANFKLTSKNNGYFHFWIDGEKVLTYNGKTSDDCPLGHFLKAGVYNAPDGAVAYNDAFKIMKNAFYAEVAPGGNLPPREGCDTLKIGDCTEGKIDWFNAFVSENTGKLSLVYEVTPAADNLGGIVALGDAPGATWEDYAMLVRFSPDGIIDVRSGDSYNAGDKLTIRINADISAGTYSVQAAKDDYTVQVAADYDFRTEQADASVISFLGLVIARETADNQLRGDIRMRLSTTARPASKSTIFFMNDETYI